MKKILIALFIIPILSVSALADTKGSSAITDVKSEKAANKAETKRLVSRLHEIRDIAKSHALSSSEKQQYREEVRGIKQKLEKMSGVYLYLSVTTIIII